MTISVSPLHRKRFEEIIRDLSALGSKESNFTKVELLFYEVMTISRSYGDNTGENGLLSSLKHLQQEQYEQTKKATKKQAQRELHIRRFVVQLKRVLSEYR
jgi:hypothetical protein